MAGTKQTIKQTIQQTIRVPSYSYNGGIKSHEWKKEEDKGLHK
jgi:hypothetical protein